MRLVCSWFFSGLPGTGPDSIEIICFDAATHKRLIETRSSDVAGHKLSSWDDVITREYQPWSSAHIVIDTATDSIKQSLNKICAALPNN